MLQDCLVQNIMQRVPIMSVQQIDNHDTFLACLSPIAYLLPFTRNHFAVSNPKIKDDCLLPPVELQEANNQNNILF